jgi:hypothetical protein
LQIWSERPEFTPVEIPNGVVEAGSSIFYKMEWFTIKK